MVPGSVGVTAVTVPTFDSGGHEDGLAANVASRHAFCSVVRREGSCLGSVTSTDLMLAPLEGILIVVSRLAPLVFEVCALLAAENDGLNPSEPQFSAWNGVDSAACVPDDPVSTELTANA